MAQLFIYKGLNTCIKNECFENVIDQFFPICQNEHSLIYLLEQQKIDGVARMIYFYVYCCYGRNELFAQKIFKHFLSEYWIVIGNSPKLLRNDQH